MGYTRTVVVCRVYRLRNFVPTGYPVLLLLLFVAVAIVVEVVKQIENKNEERILNIYILYFIYLNIIDVVVD